MTYFRSLGVIVAGGGGGSTEPTFTETLIADNTSKTDDVYLDSDWSTYDFLRFELENTNTNTTLSIISIPEIVTAIFTGSSNIVNFNEVGNNQYVCYQKVNGTRWHKYGARNLVLTKVYGINCSNMSVTKTELYQKSSIAATLETITLVEDSSDFDYIFASMCDGSYDETQLANSVTCMSNVFDKCGDGARCITNAYNKPPATYVINGTSFDVEYTANPNYSYVFNLYGVAFS